MREDPSPRHRAYREIAMLLGQLSREAREQLLDTLANWAGVTRQVRETHRAMTPAEVVELEKGGIVEVGAHTATHPRLSSLSAAEQQSEIQASKTRLEEVLGHSIRSFAYPFGTTYDYNYDSILAVQASNFENACANFEGQIRATSGTFELPRVLVRDWTSHQFEHFMQQWTSG
jgi:peptidoglycan/xylan/chitin deacetylase (PgdA/CDA1 family)